MTPIRSALFATALLVGAGVAHADPAEFLTKAIKGDNSETRLGQVAAERASNPRLRAFGRMLAQDHSQGRRQALPVLARHGVRPTTQMAPEAQAEYRKLQGMRGAAFDREFARYMVQDHRNDISDFEKEVNSHDPADIRALARQTLPVLRKHLRTAQSLS